MIGNLGNAWPIKKIVMGHMRENRRTTYETILAQTMVEAYIPLEINDYQNTYILYHIKA